MPLGPVAAPALPAVILPLLLGRTSIGPLLLLLPPPLLLAAGGAAASLLLLPAAFAALPLLVVRAAFLGGSVGVAFALGAACCCTTAAALLPVLAAASPLLLGVGAATAAAKSVGVLLLCIFLGHFQHMSRPQAALKALVMRLNHSTACNTTLSAVHGNGCERLEQL
jgi:hypothetical protein